MNSSKSAKKESGSPKTAKGYFQRESSSEQIKAYFWIAYLGVPTITSLLILAKYVFHLPFSNWVFLVFGWFGFSFYFIQTIKAERALMLIIIIAMVLSAWLMYQLMPLMINLLGSIILLASIFYTFLISNIFGIYYGKLSTYIFLAEASLFTLMLALFEYLGNYPSYPNYIVKNHFLNNPFHLIFSASIAIGGYFFLNFHMDSFFNTIKEKIAELDRARSELSNLNQGLEEKIKERTSELEEAKVVLEIKVRARTRELSRLAENLEEQVEERTRDFQKKVEDLEKFNRLAVGRELRFGELLKELREKENKEE